MGPILARWASMGPMVNVTAERQLRFLWWCPGPSLPLGWIALPQTQPLHRQIEHRYSASGVEPYCLICSGSQRSSAFTAGHARRQLRPEGV
jgi:hypothetical protein